MKKNILFIFLFFFKELCFHPAQAQIKNLNFHSPCGFIENKGQVTDQNGNKRDDVKFIYSSGSFKLILRSDGYSYQWSQVIPAGNDNSESGQNKLQQDEDDLPDLPINIISNRIDVQFTACSSTATIEGSDPLNFYTNYFNNNTGLSGIKKVKSFSSVVYKDIYKDIDLIFSLIPNKQGDFKPEYKFIIHPAADIRDIALSFNGEKSLFLDANDELQAHADLGFVKETCPAILSGDGNFFQRGKFILKGNTLSFADVKRNQDQLVIIDPLIEWGSYYGGYEKDVPDELAYDGRQHLYLTGRTHSSSMIATSGTHQAIYSGGDDVPLIKLDEQGNILWGTYYGGKGNDVAFAITTDTIGNIFLGGRTESITGIATDSAVIDTFSGGFFDVFIAKFDSSGNLLYGTYMGGDLKDEVQELATNTHGDLYVSGYTESLYGIATPGAYKTNGNTDGKIFLMRWTNDMHLLWGTYYGGNGRDRGHGVCEDKFGHVYQVGTVGSKDSVATTGAFQTSIGGKLDGFLASWTPDGNLRWATYYGGEFDERLRDVKTDNDGNIYFVGQTESNHSIATPGVFKETFSATENTDRDGLIAKFDSFGNRIWGTYYGGEYIEQPRSLRVPPTGAPIYISGVTKSEKGLATPGAYNVDLGGFNDAFMAIINHDATQLLYSTYYGGKGSESLNAGGWYGPPLTIDENENVFLSSATRSADSIATAGSYRDTILTTDEYDFFVAKFNNTCSDAWENNNDIAHAPKIPLDPRSGQATIHGEIKDSSDKDYFKITLGQNYRQLVLSLSELPIDADLFVYDGTGNELASAQNVQNISEQITLNTADSGIYYILVKAGNTPDTANNDCYKLNITASNDIPLAITPLSSEEHFTLYPNPANKATVLQLQCDQLGFYSIQITDLLGKVSQLKTVKMEMGRNNIALDLTGYASGIYEVSISGNGLHAKQTLAIQ
ncbi:MAG: T9SS type A sorting domain-containing protein [Chitinophagales bacterium]|nr:T9SS type A sorting domain-containing protein [Chitinophagales bacterium]